MALKEKNTGGKGVADGGPVRSIGSEIRGQGEKHAANVILLDQTGKPIGKVVTKDGVTSVNDPHTKRASGLYATLVGALIFGSMIFSKPKNPDMDAGVANARSGANNDQIPDRDLHVNHRTEDVVGFGMDAGTSDLDIIDTSNDIDAGTPDINIIDTSRNDVPQSIGVELRYNRLGVSEELSARDPVLFHLSDGSKNVPVFSVDLRPVDDSQTLTGPFTGKDIQATYAPFSCVKIPAEVTARFGQTETDSTEPGTKKK